jgi:type I restriction enzyme M protein
MPANNSELEKRLWSAADELRANSKLKSSEYSVPVLGLIFLRYADHKFTQTEAKLRDRGSGRRRSGRPTTRPRVSFSCRKMRGSRAFCNFRNGRISARPSTTRWRRPEAENEDLKEVLPRTYNRLDKELIVSLLKNFAAVPMDIEGDAFGKIYEYFLGKFAMSEGQKGGEFFTPASIVKLIVEIIEPYHGRILPAPAAGSHRPDDRADADCGDFRPEVERRAV